MTTSKQLAIFGPLPPSRNGIADYTYQIASGLMQRYDCHVFSDNLLSLGPDGRAVRDSELAFRSMTPETRVLHQLGNNPDHVFVLNALRKYRGVVTLHDQNLHYLYEVAGADPKSFASGMRRVSPSLGSVYARQWIDDGIKTGANYTLFPMLHEVLDYADAVIVHSEFARARLEIVYGTLACKKTFIIPHFSYPIDCSVPGKRRAKAELLIVTSGFATSAKRFDWVVAALSKVVANGLEFLWIHAGEPRPTEFDLDGLLNRYPDVASRCRITGYLSEAELNDYIADADVLLNLRSPSVGESSGTLARAMAAGRCCVVSDTAAYADLPRDAVVHIPLSQSVAYLSDALTLLATRPALRAEIGNTARFYSDSVWSLPRVIDQYEDVLEKTWQAFKPGLVQARPTEITELLFELTSESSAAEIDVLLEGCNGSLTLVLKCRNVESLAEITATHPGLLTELLPVNAEVVHVKLSQSGSHAYGGSTKSTGEVVIILTLLLS